MKQQCELCKDEIKYKSRDEFIEKGHQAVQFGNKKAHYFCNKHPQEEVHTKIKELIKKEGCPTIENNGEMNIDKLFKKQFPYHGRLGKELTKGIKDYGKKLIEYLFEDKKEYWKGFKELHYIKDDKTAINKIIGIQQAWAPNRSTALKDTKDITLDNLMQHIKERIINESDTKSETPDYVRALMPTTAIDFTGELIPIEVIEEIIEKMKNPKLCKCGDYTINEDGKCNTCKMLDEGEKEK